MNCDEVRRHWELYYDSEGDSESCLAVNEHLATCSACAEWFGQQGRLEDSIAGKLSPLSKSVDLWHRVTQQIHPAQPVLASRPLWISLAALAAGLLLALGIWYSRSGAEGQHLSRFAADVHRQLSTGAERIEFASASDEAVERYLKTRVTFPVRCPPRDDAGFVVRGGGVCRIAGKPAAYVHGRVDDGDVSIFILPDDRLAEFAHERDALQREQVHHCHERGYEIVVARIDRNVVVVIGRGQPAQLERVVRAYGTYPHPRQEAA